MKYYAHSLPGEPPEQWQKLAEHLRNVAEKAAGAPLSSKERFLIVEYDGVEFHARNTEQVQQ